MSIDSYIEGIADWGKPKPVMTKNGERNLRKAATGDKFWDAWRANKTSLKAAGVSCSRDEKTGEWSALWWMPISEEVKAQRAERIVESRAATTTRDFPHPEGLDYLPYQKAGIAAMLGRPNTLLADEMGLGKTIQAIGLINADPSIKTVLVICPNSLKINWARELERWLTRSMSVSILNASSRLMATDIIIVNYDILTKFDWPAFDLIITDEAHYIKNYKAQRSMAEKAISTKRRVRMTGTPIVNRPAELHSLISDLDPAFSNFMAFAKRYAAAHNNGFGWDMKGASHLDELQDRLRGSIMVRRLKRDVLTELPAKTRKVVELEVTPETAKVIGLMAQVQAKLGESLDADQLTSEDYETQAEKLKDEKRVAFEELSRLRHALALAKAPQVASYVADILSDDDEKKIIVFAHHLDVIDELATRLSEFGVVSVTGSTKIEDRQRAVDAFQSRSSVRVFIGGIRAAGVGLTLTASSHVVFAELDWVPGVITQCEDRAHRIGQHDNVLVEHLVINGSIDVKFAKTLVRKQKIADEALDKKGVK